MLEVLFVMALTIATVYILSMAIAILCSVWMVGHGWARKRWEPERRGQRPASSESRVRCPDVRFREPLPRICLTA